MERGVEIRGYWRARLEDGSVVISGWVEETRRIR